MFEELNILKLFFEEPSREFNTREAARLLKIAPATASKKLKILAKQGLLKERKERMLILFKADLTSSNYQDLKIYYNIKKIKSSGLIDSLNDFYLKPDIIMFGSCAFGMDTETSDFDLLVVSEQTKEFPEIKKFERKLNRKIQLFVVDNIKDLKNENLINNAVNGITIQGRIKWI